MTRSASWTLRRVSLGRSLTVGVERGKHDVRSRQQLSDRGRDIREAPRINDRRCVWPDDADHAGMPSGSTSSIASWSWLIWLEARGVVGCLGNAELAFGLGPGEVIATPIGADLYVDFYKAQRLDSSSADSAHSLHGARAKRVESASD
jgi:hypothetical protein